MKPETENTRYSPRQNTKARILQAAQEVFAERGFEGASTREIASRADVNISSLHYHWDSKETLYRAIFAHIYRQLVELVQDEITRPGSPAEARAMIDRTMGLIFDAFANEPTIPKLLLRRLIEAPDLDDAAASALSPSWKVFQEWARRFSGDEISAQDISFLLLSVQSALLVSMLDSPHVNMMLGGSIQESKRRVRLRRQVISLVENLMGVADAEESA
ncbi:MAG: TetR/AcrR family transcriptional regulator [Candidatus Binatia bacterium]|nr:TetR/AcrR family transcriptional regulator [Candidatus Binatia bacterium]